MNYISGVKPPTRGFSGKRVALSGFGALGRRLALTDMTLIRYYPVDKRFLEEMRRKAAGQIESQPGLE